MINDTTKVTLSGRQVAVPSSASIRKILAGVAAALEVSDAEIERIQRYTGLLLLWNDKLNLTAIENAAEIISRHFGESMLGLPFLRADGRLADVGSGAGFPGLALKIFRPELEVLLIEQNTKKAAFLNEAIRTIGLSRVSVQRSNYLDLPSHSTLFDAITARALGDYRQLATWARGRIADSGRIVLWLGAEESIKVSRLPAWHWEQPVRLGDSRRREILVGAPR